MRKAIAAACSFGIALLVVSCGGGSNQVDVSLFEWGVEANADSVSAGDVKFVATNDGGEDHEMVIVKGIAPADLPTDETGKVDEDALPDGAFIGEIEEFEAGGEESETFNLAAGTYTIFCNIVEEEDNGEFESHFQEGMVTQIEVGA